MSIKEMKITSGMPHAELSGSVFHGTGYEMIVNVSTRNHTTENLDDLEKRGIALIKQMIRTLKAE